MAKQVINRGTVAGDGTGESPFSGMGKANDNFTELYAGQATHDTSIAAAATAAAAAQTTADSKVTAAQATAAAPVQSVNGKTGAVVIVAPVSVVVGDNTSATSIANRTAIQAALDLGGDVSIVALGVVYIDKALAIGSDTHLHLGKNTILRLVNGPNPAGYALTSITSVGTLATVTTTNPHGLQIGRTYSMLINAVTNLAGYNGLWQMTVTGANTLTYNLVASVGGAAATYTAGIPFILNGPYGEYGWGDNLVRNKHWASAQYGLSGFASGAQLAIGLTPVSFTVAGSPTWQSGDYVLIKGDTTRAYNGVHKVYSLVGSTLTITVKSPSNLIPAPIGTLTAEQADYNIELSGGQWDWNNTAAIANGDPSWKSHGLLFNKTGKLFLHDMKVVNAGKYSIALSNADHARANNIDLDTTSDGFHLNGNIWNFVLDGLTGTSADDFFVFTGNDPANYQSNRYPMNTGAVMQDGSLMGTADSWGEIIGCKARNINPRYKNMRILISGGAAYENSGIVIENYADQFGNYTNGGSVVLAAEPFANTTTTYNDISIIGWDFGSHSPRDNPLTFTDKVNGGPYAGQQVVIKKLVLERVITRTPMVASASIANNSFFDGVNWSQWSIDQMIVKDSKFDVDTTATFMRLFAIAANNANGEYLNHLTLDNCQFNQVAGAYDFWVIAVQGSTGSRLKKVTIRNCTFDAVGTSGIQAYQGGNAGLTGVPAVKLIGNSFNKVRFAFQSQDPVNLLFADNTVVSAAYASAIYGNGTACANNIYWSNNILASGVGCMDGGVTGFVLKQGDATLSIDLTKPLRTSAGAMCKSKVAAGTIVVGEMAICDTTNAANSWKQLSNTANVY